MKQVVIKVLVDETKAQEFDSILADFYLNNDIIKDFEVDGFANGTFSSEGIK